MADDNYIDEEWRAIPRYEGRYEISSYGRARSLDRLVKNHSKLIPVKGKILCASANSNGYIRVYVGKAKYHMVHTIVCSVFHGPKPTARHQAAHGDGNKSNNHKDNLRWATPKENAADKDRHGTSPVGLRNPRCRLTEEDVKEIRKKISQGDTNQKIASAYRVTHQNINRIRTGRTWGHLR